MAALVPYPLATRAAYPLFAWPRYESQDLEVLFREFSGALKRADTCLCLRFDSVRDGGIEAAVELVKEVAARVLGAEVDLSIVLIQEALAEGDIPRLGAAVRGALLLPSSVEKVRSEFLQRMGVRQFRSYAEVAQLFSTPAPVAQASLIERNTEYWKSCADTHIADAAYYEKARNNLERICRKYLSTQATAFDVGCGSGEFSELIATHCKNVIGFDLSETLVAKANQRSGEAGAQASNCRFEVLDIATGAIPSEPRPDAIFFMGVYSTIHGEESFASVTAKFAKALAPGGLLVSRDSLTRNATHSRQVVGNYFGCFRNEAGFLAGIAVQGFEHLETILNQHWDAQQDHWNSYYLFRRR